jgi:hypothetical protein
VDKKLRSLEKGQFWWGCHQNARAKQFWHFSAPNGIVEHNIFFSQFQLRSPTWAAAALTWGGGEEAWTEAESAFSESIYCTSFGTVTLCFTKSEDCLAYLSLQLTAVVDIFSSYVEARSASWSDRYGSTEDAPGLEVVLSVHLTLQDWALG